MPNKRNSKEARARRKMNAEDNKNTKDTLYNTPALQLENLDHRLGVGVGAVKERARLKAQINPTKRTKNKKKGKK